jgi:hypothetical protein
MRDLTDSLIAVGFLSTVCFTAADCTNDDVSACDSAYGDEFETFINSRVEEPRGAELASAKERGLYSWTQRLAFRIPFAILLRSTTPLFLPILRKPLLQDWI